jgi:hypothetical protein
MYGVLHFVKLEKQNQAVAPFSTKLGEMLD